VALTLDFTGKHVFVFGGTTGIVGCGQRAGRSHGRADAAIAVSKRAGLVDGGALAEVFPGRPDLELLGQLQFAGQEGDLFLRE
jgi:hypothetical protein